MSVGADLEDYIAVLPPPRLSSHHFLSEMFVHNTVSRQLMYMDSRSYGDIHIHIKMGDIFLRPIVNTLGGKVIMHQFNHQLNDRTRSEQVLLDLGNGLVHLEAGNSTLTATVASCTLNEVYTIHDKIQKALPEEDNIADKTVRVSFWMMTEGGPSSTIKRALVPKWEDICPNYPSPTNVHLGELFTIDPNKVLSNGKLVLFHGAPGTGKTYAIRSLMDAWGAWCSFHVIMDPERLFSEASYMADVVLGEFQEEMEGITGPARRSEEEIIPWRLIIMEDTGELLSADARERSGQGLSRLLNLTDGLIGQGERIVLLISTNEELVSLHEAVIRDGRCIANVEFSKFKVQPANEWLLARGVENEELPQGGSERSIAELYRFLEKREFSKQARLGRSRIAGFVLPD